MKHILARIFFFLFFFSVSSQQSALAEGTGTWGGVPPAPNVLTVRFRVNPDVTGHGDQLAIIRSVGSGSILSGALSTYREYSDTLQAGGSKYTHVTMIFRSNYEMNRAEQSLASLNQEITEIVTGYAPHD